MSSAALDQLTDLELWNSQVMLAIACGRNHSAFKKSRRQHYCILFDALKLESDFRGLPHPTAPYGVGDLRKTPPGAV